MSQWTTVALAIAFAVAVAAEFAVAVAFEIAVILAFVNIFALKAVAGAASVGFTVADSLIKKRKRTL